MLQSKNYHRQVIISAVTECPILRFVHIIFGRTVTDFGTGMPRLWWTSEKLVKSSQFL